MKFSAVLLAGGESRRMGRDKATLEWRGAAGGGGGGGKMGRDKATLEWRRRPLWEWQMEKLRALRPEKIFLSARSDLSWRPADIELIRDTPPARGPLSGLAATLASIETDHVLALAVDMPFMTTIHLRALCDRVTDGVGVIPMIKRKAEPLCAIYPRGAMAIFLETLQADNFSLQPIVAKLVA